MEIKVKISGERFLMHNGQLADPLNEYTKALKAVSKKKSKSDEDHWAVARAEFQGGLYYDNETGPYIPGDMVNSALIQGARAVKLGKQFASSVVVCEEKIKLQYTGPTEREALWADKKFTDRRVVRVMAAKIVRTRALFRDWSAEFTIEVQDGAVNIDEVEAALKQAGQFVGIGDGRPRIAGKFVIESFEEQ